jgi:hypothetical protein
VRSDLRAALAEGRGVTAKIRWLSRPDEDGEGEGRPRWIHCTPLLGHSGAVGVWMVVLVDDETSSSSASARRFRQAPPISNVIGGKEWDATTQARERTHVNHYDKDVERRGVAGSTSTAHTANLSTGSYGLNASAGPSNGVKPRSSQQEFDPSRARSRSRARRADGTQVVSSGTSEFSFNLKG